MVINTAPASSLSFLKQDTWRRRSVSLIKDRIFLSPDLSWGSRSMDDPMPSPYALLFEALWLIPIRHYLYALILIWTAFFYKFVEFHFLGDAVLQYFRGRVNLIYNPDSPIYHGVVSRCRTLHSRWEPIFILAIHDFGFLFQIRLFLVCCIVLIRYVATPWLASPHLQTCFLNFHGLPPVFTYTRWLPFLLVLIF